MRKLLIMESDSYTTIKSSSQAIYKEKGSRFIAFAYPVSNQEEIKPIIDKISKEHHEARHHCYAYMIGQERMIW
ncbi:MAG: YigZ family protein, partial [Bacteroidales bacterium]|nr:YigZ family protein [Bacteroidales bacterium]